MPQAYRERFYRSPDDLRLYYRDYGDPLSPRVPLLCLTGLTRNSKDFERLATRFAPERRIVCPDAHAKQWDISVFPEQRVPVSPTRFRVPDAWRRRGAGRGAG